MVNCKAQNRTSSMMARRMLMLAFLFSIITFSVKQSVAEGTDAMAAEVQEASSDAAPAPQGGGGVSTDEAVVAAGKSLFTGNCTVCHSVHEKVVGPALKNISDRRKLPWIISFVQNSQKVIKSGDAYANKLFNEYGKTEMPPFDFSEEEITSIVSYIKYETENPAAKAAPISGDAGGTGATASADENTVSKRLFVLVLVGFSVILAVILVVLVLISIILKKYLKQKESLNAEDKEIIHQSFSVFALIKSRGFIFIVSFVVMAIVLKTVINGLFAIGVQKGYQPTQPIAFSHKIHAGQDEIDCNYCHTGVRVSKNANIPSPNICMNCHKYIKTESPEIQKIYAAIDYDKETGEYGPNQKPIEWVRVHNLPDLVYFNHSQHVKVGGLDCENCHGDIKEMEIVKQHAPLTMGWCIDCHRKTDINAKGNAYYDNLVEIHNENNKDAMKVEDIGGLECSKCHY